MNRLVILWGGRGNGHIHVAKAIREQVLKDKPETEVLLKDVMELQDYWNNWLITTSYHILTKYFPRLYDRLFERYLQKASSSKSISDISMIKRYQPLRLKDYLLEQKPTHIISTFAPATECLIYLRDQGFLQDVPVAQVMGDYVSSKYFKLCGDRIEMTFTPHESIRNDFEKWGLAESKVCNSGIPVALNSSVILSEAQTHAFKLSQGLLINCPTVVLVSGAAGIGNYELWVKSLIENIQDPIQIVAICGRNHRHNKKLTQMQHKVPKYVRLKVLPLLPLEDTLNFMKVADAIVTKTGGITSTEIASFGKPVLFLDINGGQESHNSSFFEKEGMGLVTRDQHKVGKLVKSLLLNDTIRHSILSAQRKHREKLSPQAFSDWLGK